MKVEGSVALVTGGANGIGKAIGFALLSKQSKVCVADNNTGDGKRTVDEFKKQFGNDSAIFVRCDVTSLQDVEGAINETVKRFGELNIVANNAGILNEINYEKLVDINLTGVMRVLQTALGQMDVSRGGKGGVIINTASSAGLTIYEIVPAYCAAKNAVVAYTRCFAMPFHYERHGVRINCLCPSMVDTDLLKFDNASGYHLEEMNLRLQEFGALKPADVAQAFIDIVEDENKNGEAIFLKLGHAPLSYQFPPPLTV